MASRNVLAQITHTRRTLFGHEIENVYCGDLCSINYNLRSTPHCGSEVPPPHIRSLFGISGPKACPWHVGIDNTSWQNDPWNERFCFVFVFVVSQLGLDAEHVTFPYVFGVLYMRWAVRWLKLVLTRSNYQCCGAVEDFPQATLKV